MHIEAVAVVVGGVSGAGKSTVGACLAQEFGWPFAEGDALHPARNIEKMTRGEPLSDAERRPWLDAVAELITAWHLAGEHGVIACSALRRSYRDRLRQAGPVWFVLLNPPVDQLRARVGARQGHFMPAGPLPGQLRLFEALEPDEPGITIGGIGAPAQVVAEVLATLRSSGEMNPDAAHTDRVSCLEPNTGPEMTPIRGRLGP